MIVITSRHRLIRVAPRYGKRRATRSEMPSCPVLPDVPAATIPALHVRAIVGVIWALVAFALNRTRRRIEVLNPIRAGDRQRRVTVEAILNLRQQRKCRYVLGVIVSVARLVIGV